MKNEKQKITSELKIILTLIIGLILLPIKLLFVLARKEKLSNALKPIIILIQSITEAKATFYLIIINLLAFFTSIILFSNKITVLVLYPSDIFNPLRWFSLITHGFLHANITHLLGNLLILFIFGRIVEKELGPLKTTTLYFSALIFAGIFSSIINTTQGINIGGVGASGAIMGLVATAILLKPFKITFAAIIPLPIMILGWLMIYADITGLFSGTNTGIGYAAHIGGFLSATMLFIFYKKEKRQLIKGLIINIITLILLLIGYFSFLK